MTGSRKKFVPQTRERLPRSSLYEATKETQSGPEDEDEESKKENQEKDVAN